MIGVRADGREDLVALTDGFRESRESCADLLCDCRHRGMRAPVLAVGDGALGFWKAVREVLPDTRAQCCWFHKQADVLAATWKSAHPGATAAMEEICNAEEIDHAQAAIKAFGIDYGKNYPKAVAKIVDDTDVLLAAGPAMAYKLIEAARTRWRAVDAPYLVALGHGDFVDVAPPEPGLLKAPRGRGCGAAGIAVMFDPGESLLFGERDGLPVGDEAGGGVVVIGTAQPEHVPHCSALRACVGGHRGERVADRGVHGGDGDGVHAATDPAAGDLVRAW